MKLQRSYFLIQTLKFDSPWDRKLVDPVVPFICRKMISAFLAMNKIRLLPEVATLTILLIKHLRLRENIYQPETAGVVPPDLPGEASVFRCL